MKLKDYKKSIKYSLRLRTLVFLLDNERVLLGLKKRGFGKGNWLGIGGKVENGESIEDGARREVAEEISVTVSMLEKRGVMNFYFPHVVDESWNQQVHIFVAKSWEGEPRESDEMKPRWYAMDDIPYKEMWEDAFYWFPHIMQGTYTSGEFMFDESFNIVDQTLTL